MRGSKRVRSEMNYPMEIEKIEKIEKTRAIS